MRIWLLLLLALGPGVGMVWAQFPMTTPSSNPATADLNRAADSNDIEPYVTREMQQRQLKRQREQRQHEVLSDTALMVRLATAMKEEVDRGNKTLNADILKDAEEIGKLAKRVSDRIKSQ